jgi:prepilin-type N-terminal cleavage/methylation domain-containing protein
MNSLNRGFTLIELLVVIAIIGVLSAITLSQLNTARNKGADAAVKSNLDNIRATAELLYDAATGSNGYNAVCSDSRVSNMQSAATSAGGNGGTCANAVGYWVAWAGLKQDTTKAWCVDNTGTARQITKPTSALSTCP